VALVISIEPQNVMIDNETCCGQTFTGKVKEKITLRQGKRQACKDVSRTNGDFNVSSSAGTTDPQRLLVLDGRKASP
jgi:hypothetical protein